MSIDIALMISRNWGWLPVSKYKSTDIAWVITGNWGLESYCEIQVNGYCIDGHYSLETVVMKSGVWGLNFF
jgi:hypothetical protein